MHHALSISDRGLKIPNTTVAHLEKPRRASKRKHTEEPVTNVIEHARSPDGVWNPSDPSVLQFFVAVFFVVAQALAAESGRDFSHRNFSHPQSDVPKSSTVRKVRIGTVESHQCPLVQ